MTLNQPMTMKTSDSDRQINKYWVVDFAQY